MFKGHVLNYWKYPQIKIIKMQSSQMCHNFWSIFNYFIIKLNKIIFKMTVFILIINLLHLIIENWSMKSKTNDFFPFS